jgi:hypothetical protein
VPDAPIGQQFPVASSLSLAGPEIDSFDNDVQTAIMVAHQVFLPAAQR